MSKAPSKTAKDSAAKPTEADQGGNASGGKTDGGKTSGSKTDGGKASGGKKKLLLLLIPVVLIGAGAGLWFTGILPPLLGLGKEEGSKAHEANAHADGAVANAKVPVFVDLPDLVANLNAGQRKTSFIKLKARLEVSRPEDQAVLTAAMPRLQDLFTTYLREVRPEELRGSVGTYRLREELLARANIVASPAHVLDVLFIEMLVQ